MQNTNLKITTLLKIAGDQLRTVETCHRAIQRELDRTPARTPTNRTRRTRNLTPALEQVRQVLLARNYPVTIRTICRELDITSDMARYRIMRLRACGVPVHCNRRGKGAKYRLTRAA